MKKLLFLLPFCLLSLACFPQRIAVMGALDQEIAILLESLEQTSMVTHGGIDFYTGKLKGREVVILKAGVGKVNAAYSTAVLTQNFQLSHLIFTGVAGGLHPEALPGDLVIGEKLVQYDFGKIDSAGFTVWPFRQFAGGPASDIYIHSDPQLVQTAQKVASGIQFSPVAGRTPTVFSGVIATGDLFVSSSEKAGGLYKEFNALATEMEGAAVGHVCQTLGIPFIVIRSCSDNANSNAHLNFSQFVGPASVNSARLVMGMLGEIR